MKEVRSRYIYDPHLYPKWPLCVVLWHVDVKNKVLWSQVGLLFMFYIYIYMSSNFSSKGIDSGDKVNLGFRLRDLGY